MNNLFSFEYSLQPINNLDGSESRFGIVYGDRGNVIHTKKDSYHIIHTADIEKLGQTFVAGGYDVKSFSHRDGEVIGLNIGIGDNMTAVGDKSYRAIITIPNNGGGKGFMSIQEVRLICTNGATRLDNTVNATIKIPHTIDYAWYLETMQKSIEAFKTMIQNIEAQDAAMNNQSMERTDLQYQLNKWFFDEEMPAGHKSGMSFDEFRKLLATDPTEIKSIDRYNELMTARDKEIEYNNKLGLELSKYTLFATITNYLSRRVEKSQSEAPKEIQSARTSDKLKSILATI